jgi:high-affinity iron transporter
VSSATSPPPRPRAARSSPIWWWLICLAAVAALVYMMATASTGPVDPTATSAPQSRLSVVLNSATIVFREGLEAVLIFAAVTASFLGANRAKRRPVTLGAGIALAASVAAWFLAQALLDVASPLGPRLEAITGFLAVAVLLLVLNWFVHNVYWTGWISRHHRQRRELLARGGLSATVGLIALGFTTVFREGVEVVLFLQNLQLKAGSAAVLEGVALGLAGTAVVGVLTFWLHHKLPYRRMLVLTGGLVGVVLVVMIGGTALSFVNLGWLPDAPTPFTLPGWLGAWFEIYSNWTTLAVQVLAAALVIGSYLLAEHLKVRRPARRGRAPATRADTEPTGALQTIT